MSVKPLGTQPTEQAREGRQRFDGVILKAKGDAQAKEDRIATDNEVWPPLDKTQVEAPKDGKIRYELDGKGVVVERSVNPALYSFLVNLHALAQSPEQRAEVLQALDDGQAVADRNTALKSWGDYAEFRSEGKLEDAQVITYTTTDGETVSVSRALTPELFASVQQLALSRRTVEERAAAGREVAGADTYVADHDISTFGWPSEFGNGVIQFETKDGKKYVVSAFENKEMYDRVVAKREDYDRSEASLPELRDKHELPDLDALNLLGLDTGEKADKKDEKGLTVVELATKNLLDHYRELIKDGKVDKNSDIYKFVMAIEAKSATEGGRTITPYIEEPQGGNTWRRFDSEGETLSKEDLQDILDGNEVDKLLNDLLTRGDGEKDKIGKEFQAEIDKAIDKIDPEQKTKLADQLYDTLTGLDFVEYLADLKAKGLEGEAQAEVARLISSLETLDPERAAKAQSALQQNSVLVEIEKLVGDPSLIPEEFKELAYKDLGALIKTILKSSDIPRRVQDSIEKFYNELLNDKTKMNDFIDLNKQLQDQKITQEEFNRQVTNSYKSLDVSKNEFAKALGTLNKYGVLGSISAFGSLGGAIYALAAKNGQLSDEPLERLAVAKDFTSFLGAGAQFEKTKIFDLFTKTNTAELLGLSKTLPEIWGKESTLGKRIEEELRSRGISGLPDLAKERVNADIELASLNANGGGDAVEEVRLSAEAAGAGPISEAQGRELVDDIITRAGGEPPEDYARAGSLRDIAREQNLTITDQVISDAVSERLELPEAATNEFVERLEGAASRSPSAGSYYDDVISVYESYFQDQDIAPPSRESFEEVFEERRAQAGGSQSLELDRQAVEDLFEREGRTPPPADVLDTIVAQANASDVSKSSYYDAVASVYESYFEEHDVPPPSRESIREALEERRGRAGSGAGSGLDREAIEQLFEQDGRTPPEGGVIDKIVAQTAGSGAGMNFDDVVSVYESFFEERNIEPPSRESFDALLEERQRQPGGAQDLTLDRQSVEQLFEHDGRTPPPADVIEEVVEQAGESLSTRGVVDPAVVQDAITTPGKPAIKPGLSARIVGSVTKVLGVAPDLLSVADIVLGGIAIKDAIASGSDLGKASGALQVISGAAGTTAGIVGAVGLFANLGALAGVTGPLFLVTATLGLVTGIIGVFLDHEKKQKATDKEGQWFKDLADLGLTQDDWGDKLEYARYSFYEHEGRDAPEGESLYDYQEDEWAHFRETPAEGGSSVNRLDDDLHREKYDKPFYEANREVIHDTREYWGTWKGGDEIVSRKDLNKIAEGGGSDQEKAAARFLLDNPGFFDQLDTQFGRGSQDGYVSTNDLNTWLRVVGAHEEPYGRAFFDEHQATIELIRERWGDWKGGDEIVSRGDLEKIAAGDGSEEEKAAARFLLEDQGFFDQLDNLGKNDRRDGKISTGDLLAWLQAVGVEALDKSDLQWTPDPKPAWQVGRF